MAASALYPPLASIECTTKQTAIKTISESRKVCISTLNAREMVMFLDAIEETLFTVTGDIRYSPSDDVEAAQGNGRNHGVQANSRDEAIRTAACEMVLSVLSSCKDVISFSLVVLFLVAFLMLSKIAMYGFLMISVLLIVGVNICDYKNTVDKRIEVKKES